MGKTNRRQFIQTAGLGGLAFAGAGMLNAVTGNTLQPAIHIMDNHFTQNLIGAYGPWAASLNGDQLPSFSFRNNTFNDINAWRTAARKQLRDRLAIPSIEGIPAVRQNRQYVYDGLHIEELTWQLPYGNATAAILLKPANATGRLPGILAFHDHGGNKYFGTRKITKTNDAQHPMMVQHQQEYYEGRAWANDLARRGYVVLVSDAFPFASRRVLLNDVPPQHRNGLTDADPEKTEHITAYNEWAGAHEHIMAKSLFCAGTTWPGVFFAEDQKALDVLCARPDVDTNRIGCCGLSGGGMRTVFMAGLDERIKCAIPVGFMTTWKDFLLYKSFTHTWMTYVPLLPNELDFPEIIGLHAPLPTLVLNDSEDDLYTLPEMKQADTILQEVYRNAGAPERYRCSFYPGPHKFDQKMQAEAFDWFDQWL